MRFVSLAFLALLALAQRSSSEELDVVAIAYNSYDSRAETLVFASVDENDTPVDSISTLNAGMGQHLWQVDEYGPELKRGWMFRLRLTIQEVIDEYNRRGKQDFLAMVSDGSDVYVSKSMNGNTLSELKRRFLNQFNESKIVFSTQIYCCNPWELRSVGRADWDRLYEDNEPSSIYKHLNAGLYIGYASALIEMAEEVGLWDKDYHRHEGFHSLMGTDAAKHLSMRDMEVDDDEWQLSAWFFEDQKKSRPLAALDFKQDLFAVTGTFRAQQTLDDDWHIFSKGHFLRMFGQFPSSFPDPDANLDKLVVCPYEHNAESKEWTSTITGSHPLIFHFAGNDWLCACKIFAAEGFTSITGKFRENCIRGMAEWNERVHDAILQVAGSEDTEEEMFLYHMESSPPSAGAILQTNNLSLQADSKDSSFGRKLDEDDEGPYDRRHGRELDEDDEGPYDRRLDRALDEDDEGPYDRRLGRALDEDNEGPYDRRLWTRRLDDGPYDRRHHARVLDEDDEGPYDRRLWTRRLDDDGPYDRRHHHARMLDEDEGPYDRRLRPRRLDDDGPYDRRHARVLDEDDKGPYDRRLWTRRLDDYGPYDRRHHARMLDEERSL